MPVVCKLGRAAWAVQLKRRGWSERLLLDYHEGYMRADTVRHREDDKVLAIIVVSMLRKTLTPFTFWNFNLFPGKAITHLPVT